MTDNNSSLRASGAPALASTNTDDGAPLSAAVSAHTPGPWEYVPSTEHHGPYVTTAADGTFGDIADCYCMSNPAAVSTRNGGSSFPVHHQRDHADANARLIAAAPDLNGLAEEVATLRVYVNNPSAWDHFSEDVSELLRLLVSRADAVLAQVKGR